MPSAWYSRHQNSALASRKLRDLVAPEVEDERAPVGVRAAARVGVLVQRRAVEARERPVVAREVRGDPVEDHADAALVQAVDELAQVVGRRRSAGSGRSTTSPGSPTSPLNGCAMTGSSSTCVKPMSVHVVGQLVGQLERRSASGCPRAGCAARSRGGPRRSRSAARSGGAVDAVLGHPLLVAATRGAGGGRPTPSAAAPRRRTRTGRPAAAARRPGRGSRTCSASPRPRRGRTAPRCRVEPSERIGCSRPSQRVEVADDADRPRRRRPDGERDAGHAVDLAHVRAELRVELLVAALAGEVEVELAERRQERVRVAQRERAAVGVGDLELVAQRQLRARDRALEHAAGMARSSSTGSPPVGPRGDRARVRAERADDDAAVRRRARPAGGAARAWSRRRRIARSMVRTWSTVLMSWQRLLQQSRDPGDRDAHPVGAVVELVAQLVDGLLELEDRSAAARRPPRPAAAAAGSTFAEVARRGTPRARVLPAVGRGRAALELARPRRRRRTSAACPRRRAAASACAGARAAAGRARPRSRGRSSRPARPRAASGRGAGRRGGG